MSQVLTTQILFSPKDDSLPSLILRCEYTAWVGEPMVMYGDNPYPGSPPGCEVSSVLCVDVDEAGVVPDNRIGEIIGALAWQADSKQIIDKVWEQANEEADDGPDPDDARDAYIERQQLRRERGE